jgi:hypothetical protein
VPEEILYNELDASSYLIEEKNGDMEPLLIHEVGAGSQVVNPRKTERISLGSFTTNSELVGFYVEVQNKQNDVVGKKIIRIKESNNEFHYELFITNYLNESIIIDVWCQMGHQSKQLTNKER